MRAVAADLTGGGNWVGNVNPKPPLLNLTFTFTTLIHGQLSFTALPAELSLADLIAAELAKGVN